MTHPKKYNWQLAWILWIFEKSLITFCRDEVRENNFIFSYFFFKLKGRMEWNFWGFLKSKSLRACKNIRDHPYITSAKGLGGSKGQLISKCLFGFIVWTKISTKNLTNSALEWVGQNLSNFSLVFWSKRWHQKDILKLTDL